MDSNWSAGVPSAWFTAALTTLGYFLCTLGTVFDDWSRTLTDRLGLWDYSSCNKYKCFTWRMKTLTNVPAWHKETLSLALSGQLMSCTAAILAVINLLIKKPPHQIVRFLCAAFAGASAFCMMKAGFIYNRGLVIGLYVVTLSSSFYLVVAGSVLCGLVVLFCVLDMVLCQCQDNTGDEKQKLHDERPQTVSTQDSDQLSTSFYLVSFEKS